MDSSDKSLLLALRTATDIRKRSGKNGAKKLKLAATLVKNKGRPLGVDEFQLPELSCNLVSLIGNWFLQGVKTWIKFSQKY